MDKQKQIEDLTALIDSFNIRTIKQAKYVAEYIVDKLNYRKIPEGAVVLMGTETEQRFEDLMVAFDEMGFMPYTTHPFPEEYVETWKQRLIFVFGQLRKETAEKFAERVKMAFYYEFDELIPSIMADKIDEICKEIIGGGVNERLDGE